MAKFLASILLSIGGKKHPKDECVYIFREGEAFLFLATHVDDLFPLFNTQAIKIKDKILDTLKTKMEIDNRGTISFALDMKIERDINKGILKISQTVYTESLLNEYDMQNTVARETPATGVDLCEKDIPTNKEEKEYAAKLPIRQLIGRLWWLALISRPDIYCALHRCAIWQNKPSKNLWKHLITILKYLKATPHFGIIFQRPNESNNNLIFAMVDSSFATEPNSKSRYIYFFLF